MFEPGIHYGSVYDYYQLQAPRERPGGYSTLVPQDAFDFYFFRNRLSCGVWLPGDEETLEDFDIQHVTFHQGMYAQGTVPGGLVRLAGPRRPRLLARRPRRAGDPVLSERRIRISAVPVPEPLRGEPHFCEGWTGRVMDERQAPFWVYGQGTLRLAVSAPEDTPAALWLDGEVVDRAQVRGTAAFEAELAGDRWHAIVLEVPLLLETAPPRGLELESLTLAP